MSASARMRRRGRRRPLTGKLPIARCVCAPQSASTGTCTSPSESVSFRVAPAMSYALLLKKNVVGHVLRARLEPRARQIGGRLAQALGEHLREGPQKLHRQLRLLANDLVEIAPLEAQQARALLGRRARRARLPTIDERHLSDVRARLEVRDEGVVLVQANLAAQEDEHLVARRALLD